MAKRRRTQRVSGATARSAAGSPIAAASRPVAWCALISAAVLTTAGPVSASPANDPDSQIPNTGARPVPSGVLQLPGASTVVAVPPLGALAQQITAAQIELGQIGEQLKLLNLDRAAARTKLALADRDRRAAADRRKDAEKRAEVTAAEAFKAAARLPPGSTSDLRGLGALSAVPDDDIPGTGAARELLNAQEDERAKLQAYSEAIAAEERLAGQYLALQASYRQRERAYLDLWRRNAAQLAAIEREREAREQSLGAQYIGNGATNGYAANPKALAAVRVALDQLGDPYVWAAEGPDAFDCSGLTWYSYHHGAGYSLPRVSRDQYLGTRSRAVSRFNLLPGDLIFFATNPNDWTTIFHEAMYIGNGKMVSAPTTGDVVKISTVWWSAFFAATRVFGEVPAPAARPAPSPPVSGGNAPPAPGPTSAPSSRPPSPNPTTKPPASSPSNPPTSSPSNPPSSSPSRSVSPTPSTPSPTVAASGASPDAAGVATSP